MTSHHYGLYAAGAAAATMAVASALVEMRIQDVRKECNGKVLDIESELKQNTECDSIRRLRS
jgi:hypothetical protein